jgi:thiol-disulfide isomerase/thioredoxin
MIIATGLFSCSSLVEENKATTSKETIEPVNDARKLPAFRMTSASGEAVDLSSFKGKRVFVNLWATWCGPCRREIPSIEALAAKVNSEQAIFVMLSLDENFEVAKEFAEKEEMKVPVYYPAEKLPDLFDVDGIPATFIFDEDGNLVKENMGADNYDTPEYLRMLTKT